MKKNCTFLLASAVLAFSSNIVSAQHKMEFKHHPNPTNKIYFSTGFDSYLLSTASMEKAGQDAKLTTPRFTAFFNFGINANFDFNKRIGLFWGLNIKNIGFIEQYDKLDSTVIRRSYTFGIPLGLKIGNIRYGNYVLVGGGVDFPFNYREKGFVNRNDKTKFNEWFSSRTPAVSPYVFLGAHLRPGFVFKLQYYPANFLNPDFTTTVNGLDVQPYKGYKVNLLLLTFGFDFPYRPKEMMEEMKAEKNKHK